MRYAYIYPHKHTTDFHGQLLVDGGRRDVYHHLLWLQHRQASWLEGACVYVCVCGRRKCVYMCVWRVGVRVCNVRVWRCVCVFVMFVPLCVCVRKVCACTFVSEFVCVRVSRRARQGSSAPPHTHTCYAWLMQRCRWGEDVSGPLLSKAHVSTHMHTCIYTTDMHTCL